VNSALADEFGITDVLARLDRMQSQLEQLTARPEVFSVEEVAELLQIGRDAVYRLLKDGLLWKAETGTSTVRIPRAAVENLLARPDQRAPKLKAVS